MKFPKFHPVFIISAIVVSLFVFLGAVLPAEVGGLFEDIQGFITGQFGWVYIVSVTIFLLFVIWLFLSPYGSIKLGKDDDEPEFSRVTWFAMLFSAGMGIGLLFWGVAEPVWHFDAPPRTESGTAAAETYREARAEAAPIFERGERAEQEAARFKRTLPKEQRTLPEDEGAALTPGQAKLRSMEAEAESILGEAEGIMAEVADEKQVAIEAAKQATNISYFHWGLHAWGIYILMGLALAYFAFRHDLPLSIRSTLYPLIGNRIYGPIGHAVEVLAVFGTLFGLATSLGFGASQINAGAHKLFASVPADSVVTQMIIIGVITGCATISVVSGLNVGIRRLSELNMILGVVLMIFIFVAGPTLFLLGSYVQSIGEYLSTLPMMTFRTDAFVAASGGEGSSWQSGWTMFYWGWWISWSPFVGMFVARISRGRTIREFVFGVLLVPALLTFLWITIFGGTALHMEIFGPGGMVEAVKGESGNVATALFDMIALLPALKPFIVGATVLGALLVATYFVTSSDSASLVVDMLTSGGDPNPPTWTRVFWAVTEGAVAAILLYAGGLGALRNAAIITGFPFCIILLIMCYSITRGLRAEREAGIASVPYTPTHPTDHHAATEQEVLEYGGEDWKTRLRQIVGSQKLAKEDEELHEARQTIQDFIDQTVKPAFENIKAELERQGRTVVIHEHEASARLVVLRESAEEFRYAIRGRAFRRAAVAFPELDDPNTPRILRAEVVLRSGVTGEYELEEFTQHGIIEDFLNEYAKWMGW